MNAGSFGGIDRGPTRQEQGTPLTARPANPHGAWICDNTTLRADVRRGMSMEKEMRLLEEWKANNELLKFYEDLKQKRFAHFLTIQTAFLAFFALLAKDALTAFSMVSLTALVLIAIPPLVISFYFLRVDTRSRAFVDTANTRLLLIEEEWKNLSPDDHFSTYQQLFAVLSRHDAETVGKYLDARKLEGDPFSRLAQSKSAHASEHAILRMFWWLWIFLASLAALIHLIWHMIHGFGALS
jgi:hypothetical protein